MSVIRGDGASTISASTAAYSYVAEISLDESDNIEKPRIGLGSTANENIALRRNYREMELLWKTQKTLVEEEGYVLKLIELYEKSVQLNYKRLTKRVKKIKSHLTEEEIIEMENDLRKKEFADKYRMLLHNQGQDSAEEDFSKSPCNNLSTNPALKSKSTSQKLEVLKEESEFISEGSQDSDLKQSTEANKISEKENASKSSKQKYSNDQQTRSQSCQVKSSQSNGFSNKKRPETTPNLQPPSKDSTKAIDDIIPSLDMLLDQLHNIKSNQFYENQRKLKLYEIRLLGEELKLKKEDLLKSVDRIINWDKKEEVKEEVKEEEEKPRTRKTSFMRSVIRNFSMELMMKTMQYGWADLGQCRYLRNRGGDGDQEGSGANTLAKDTMKINLDQPSSADEKPQDGDKLQNPGFDANGKMIRTADLLGLK